MTTEGLEKATTMRTAVTAFERSLDEIRQEGLEQGIREGLEQGIREGLEQGIREGLEQGIREEHLRGIELGRMSVLRELAARKFGPAVAEELVRLLDRTADSGGVARGTEALLDCDAAEDFVKRVRKA